MEPVPGETGLASLEAARWPEATAESKLAFLAETSRRLADSLDYEATLRTVAGLALPFLGSWCIVDLVEPDGSMRRLAILHPDPRKRELVAGLEKSWPPSRDDPLGAPQAVRTREIEVIPFVDDEMLVAGARGTKKTCARCGRSASARSSWCP